VPKPTTPKDATAQSRDSQRSPQNAQHRQTVEPDHGAVPVANTQSVHHDPRTSATYVSPAVETPRIPNDWGTSQDYYTTTPSNIPQQPPQPPPRPPREALESYYSQSPTDTVPRAGHSAQKPPSPSTQRSDSRRDREGRPYRLGNLT
jgi:hypothetical protein